VSVIYYEKQTILYWLTLLATDLFVSRFLDGDG